MFHSILYPDKERHDEPRYAEAPDYFRDLNLDRMLQSITKGRGEFHLEQFFWTPLKDVESVQYRQEVMKDLENKEILDRFIKDKVDGIAISCIESNLVTPSINQAVAVGIPVITWDSDAPQSKRTAFYGLDDYEAGVKMGEEVVRLLGQGGGEVAALTTGGADNLQKRINGFLSVIRNHPIKLVEAFDVQDDASTAVKVVASATRNYPNLKAWISVGGWPAFNADITAPLDPARTYMITFDTIPAAWDMIKSGRIHMALGQKYFGWGSVPTRLLYDIVANGKSPDSPFVNSGVDVVTKENIEEYIQKWKQMEAGQAVE